MKECDKRNSHTSSKLHMIYISYNNGRRPVTKNSLHFTPLLYTCRQFTSSHLNFTQLHFTPVHHTCRHFTSSHLNFTQLRFTTLSFGLTTFQYPTAPFHLPSLHFTAILGDFRHTCIPFILPHLYLLS
jgi:hypothetical protein